MDITQGPRHTIVERGLRLLQTFQSRRQRLQETRVKPGPDASGIDQSITLVNADEKRPKAGSRSGRIGIPADDEFLPQKTFHLEPIAPSSSTVGLHSSLGNHAFQAKATGRLVKCRPPSYDMIAVAHCAIAGHGLQHALQ